MPDTDNQVPVLRAMIDGYQISQAIGVAASLGIADAIAGCPRSSEDIANDVDANPHALSRLLLALESIGVVVRDDSGRFTLTPMGAFLRSDHPSSVRAIAMHATQPSMWQAWGNLLTSVQTGIPAFATTHGMSVWEYRDRDEEAGGVFDAAMAESQSVAAAITQAYDFDSATMVVDIGGGMGALITEILTKHRSLAGTLFEHPRTCEQAREAIATSNVSSRCTVVSGNFFESIPAGGDLYILKGVLHDWSDVQANRILTTCHGGMPANAMLLVIEQVTGGNANSFAQFMDLHMLVIHGGKERTASEFETLLHSSGFTPQRFIPTSTGLVIIEAHRTDASGSSNFSPV